MKVYEAPDFIKVDLITERILEDSIIDPENKDAVDLGPAIDIFPKN